MFKLTEITIAHKNSGRLVYAFIPVIYLLSLQNIAGQMYPAREYGVVDGLPQSQVHEIFQDSRDFLWITTRNGISRFDGNEFVNYFRINGLPSNSINQIIEDANDTIWAVAREGISKYTGRNFVFFPPPPGLKSIHYGRAAFYNGNIMVQATSSLGGPGRLYSLKNGVYTDFSARFPLLDSMKISAIGSRKSGDQLIVLDKYERIYRLKDDVLTVVEPEMIDGYKVSKADGIAVKSLTIFNYDGKQTGISGFYASDTGRGDQVTYLIKPDPDFPGMNSTGGKTLPVSPMGYFKDKEGVLWLSSENNLFRILGSSFYGFTDDETGTTNLWAITEDRFGHILLGSIYGSLVEFDGKEFISREDHKRLFKGQFAFYKGSRKMKNGDVWFSTNRGVIIWDGNKFERQKKIPETSQVCYIYEDPKNGSVLVGTDFGLYIISGGEVQVDNRFTDNDLGVIEGAVRINEGEYLLSGHKGLVELKNNIPYSLKEVILPDVNTYTLEMDSRGGIWVTSDEGLFMRRGPGKEFEHGLPETINSLANSICIMDEDHVLVGKGTDICVIDLRKFYNNEKDYFRLYDKSDGFDGSDCIDNGIIKDRTGKFWILTANRIVRFDPSKLKVNKKPPTLHITGLYFQNDSMEWQPVEEANLFYGIPELIKLSKHQSKIQITFTGISTTNPEKVLMQYRLTGIDNKWSTPSVKRNVIFENLPPGKYTFELKGTNSDGIETAEPLSMVIRVMPMVWQTLLFKIMSVFVAVVVTVVLTMLVINIIQKRKKEEEKLRNELSRLQLTSVFNQFDPHFTFNVISSVGSLIMTGEKKVAYDYITKLSFLLRSLLSDVSLAVRPITDEVEFVTQYCELQKLRFRERFNYEIYVAPEVDPDRKIPRMTIQTFVENAVKHGFQNRESGGTVKVNVDKTDNNLRIVIADDGVGRSAAALSNAHGSGNGTRMVRGIFDLMNSKNQSQAFLEIRDLTCNHKSSGTEVFILIPDDYIFDINR